MLSIWASLKFCPLVILVPCKESLNLFHTFQNLTLYSTDTHFDTSTKDSFFENVVGKGEIARNEKFLLLP